VLVHGQSLVCWAPFSNAGQLSVGLATQMKRQETFEQIGDLDNKIIVKEISMLQHLGLPSTLAYHGIMLSLRSTSSCDNISTRNSPERASTIVEFRQTAPHSMLAFNLVN